MATSAATKLPVVWPGTSSQLTSGAGGAVTVAPASALASGTLTISNVGVGTLASRPAQGSGTKMYIVTDGPWPYVDDGTSWRPMIRGNVGYDPPLASTWDTSANYGTALTVTDLAGSGSAGKGLSATAPYGGGGTEKWTFATKTLGAGAIVEALIGDDDAATSGYNTTPYLARGICLRKSSTNEWVVFVRAGIQYGSSATSPATFACYYGNSYTARTTVADAVALAFTDTSVGATWLRLEVSGADVIASISHDGARWVQFAKVAKSTVWASSGSPNQGGIAANVQNSGTVMHVQSFRTY